MAPCHPSHNKAGRDTRSIQRHHKWAFGSDPSDPDADPNSPWQYLKLEVVEGGDSVPNQRHLLKGGPESGLPCPCGAHPHCNEMTRVAAEMSAAEMIRQKEVQIVNEASLNEKDWQRLEETIIVALVCPTCECVTQMERRFLPRSRKL